MLRCCFELDLDITELNSLLVLPFCFEADLDMVELHSLFVLIFCFELDFSIVEQDSRLALTFCFEVDLDIVELDSLLAFMCCFEPDLDMAGLDLPPMLCLELDLVSVLFDALVPTPCLEPDGVILELTVLLLMFCLEPCFVRVVVVVVLFPEPDFSFSLLVFNFSSDVCMSRACVFCSVFEGRFSFVPVFLVSCSLEILTLDFREVVCFDDPMLLGDFTGDWAVSSFSFLPKSWHSEFFSVFFAPPIASFPFWLGTDCFLPTAVFVILLLLVSVNGLCFLFDEVTDFELLGERGLNFCSNPLILAATLLAGVTCSKSSKTSQLWVGWVLISNDLGALVLEETELCLGVGTGFSLTGVRWFFLVALFVELDACVLAGPPVEAFVVALPCLSAPASDLDVPEGEDVALSDPGSDLDPDGDAVALSVTLVLLTTELVALPALCREDVEEAGLGPVDPTDDRGLGLGDIPGLLTDLPFTAPLAKDK